jgi:glycosyltransferase involved in cell wall biosynthesis
MRILFWSETFWPRVGGVENLAARLLPELRARGHEFTVVTWDYRIEDPDMIWFEGVPVYRFPFFSRNGEDNFGSMMEHRHRVTKLKRDFRPDLVHINCYGRTIFFHLTTAGVHPAPMLVTLHQALPDEAIGRETLLEKLLQTADWVTACSAAVLYHAGRLAPKIVPRSSVIRNALKHPVVEPRPLSFDPPRIFFLGRLVPEKGLDWALSALPAVFRRFPNARFIVAGDGPDSEKLKAQTVSLSLAPWVEFLGAVSPESVPSLLNDATLVVMPSRIEGFGLVALEAAMMGRPVVAARIGGLPEVVVDGQTGLLVEQCDIDSLAQAILRLLGDRELARQFGEAARRRALEVFDWKRYVDSYDALYRQLRRGIDRLSQGKPGGDAIRL